MAIHVVFVATFDPEHIAVSPLLPEKRPMPGFETSRYPVHQGYSLTRLRIDAEEFPILPVDDLTPSQYQEWLSRFPEETVSQELVNPTLVALGLGGLTVATTLSALDTEEYGPILEAKVVNVGPYPIGKVHVHWNGRWEPLGDSQLIGKGFHFAAVGSRPKQLAPGKSATFALLKPHLQAGLSYAASLPPDQYQIEVYASHPNHPAMHEIHRVPGSEMGDLIDRLEHFLESEESK